MSIMPVGVAMGNDADYQCRFYEAAQVAAAFLRGENERTVDSLKRLLSGMEKKTAFARPWRTDRPEEELSPEAMYAYRIPVWKKVGEAISTAWLIAPRTEVEAVRHFVNLFDEAERWVEYSRLARNQTDAWRELDLVVDIHSLLVENQVVKETKFAHDECLRVLTMLTEALDPQIPIPPATREESQCFYWKEVLKMAPVA